MKHSPHPFLPNHGRSQEMSKSPLIVALVISLGAAFATTAHAQAGSSSSGNAQGSRAAAPSASSAAAQQATAQQGAHPRPGSRQFGEHVSGMAPEHPKMHGWHFGECVSGLATTGDCAHHDDEE